MMKKKHWAVGILIALQTLMGTPEALASARSTKKIGIAVGFITEPFPSIIGYSLSYNIAHFLRLGVGYGSVTATDPSYTIKITTIAADAKLFLLDWNFAPFLDAGFTQISGTITGTGSASGIGLSSTGSAPYFGGGLDWQTYLGFNFGMEFKMLTKNGKAVSLPGVYFGWYF